MHLYTSLATTPHTTNDCTEMSDQTTLWCLVEGDDFLFPVRASSTTYIADLKTLIKGEKQNSLQRVDAPNLRLWKVCYF